MLCTPIAASHETQRRACEIQDPRRAAIRRSGPALAKSAPRSAERRNPRRIAPRRACMGLNGAVAHNMAVAIRDGKTINHAACSARIVPNAHNIAKPCSTSPISFDC